MTTSPKLTKRCPRCPPELGEQPVENFNRNALKSDGLDGMCKLCKRKANQVRTDANRLKNAERLASEFLPLGGGNYRAVNAGTTDTEGRGLKQQEFTVEQGELAGHLRAAAVDPTGARLASFVTNLAEDEGRFENRRLARSVSLSAARDELALRRFRQAASEYLTDKIQPSGEALRPVSQKPLKRVVNVLLSDLHFGAELTAVDNPNAFTAEEESRRFGKIIAEVCDYKLQHRADSSLNVLLNGDLIEGYLLHDMRDGAPLTEQVVAFWKYMGSALQAWSAAYPKVTVHFQPGNHGRNRLRHPGRATSSKWDNFEVQAAIGLSMMCSGLPNVEFKGCGFEHRMPVSSIILPGDHRLFLAHGDTEPKIGDPDTKAAQNFSELSNVNATLRYAAKPFDVFAFGHFHKARVQRCLGFTVIFNGALVPSNGHARASGYARESCGQQLWESVEGYPVGDMRFLEVGAAEDRDVSLNRHCPAFRFAA